MITLLQGDAREMLQTIPDQSVQCVVTSPPYFGLRAYSDDPREMGRESTPALYVAALLAVFSEVWRVLRADGVCWLNLGDSYAGNGNRTGEGETRALKSEKFHGGQAHLQQRRVTGDSGLPDKNLLGIPWRVAFALQDAGWILRSDIIWSKPNCLSGGTTLYARTQKGEMPAMLKDLVRLRPETVQLWNGERWTQVLSWTENPRPDNPIELTLRNGQRIGCTPDHLWPTQRGNVRADALRVGDIIRTCRLPEPATPINPTFIPDNVGWFVGLYIAEGSMSKGCIQLSSHAKEQERYERLCDLADQYGGTCRKHQTSDNGMTINLYSPVLRALIELYVSGHDAGDKHLTSAAWKRSNRFLDAVLRGYLAGDGHYDEPNDRYRLGFTRNYNLESDLRTLCARLGYSVRLNLSTSKIGEDIYPTFRGELRMTRSNHHNSKQDGEVVDISGSKARKFWDVTVADDPYLFSLASGVLTHNCMPESVTDRPTRAHEYLFLFAKSPRYYYDAAAIEEESAPSSKARAKYNGGAPSPKSIQGTAEGVYCGPPTTGRAYGQGRNKRSVWTIATQPFSGVSVYGTYRIASPDCRVHDYPADLARVLEYDAQRDASDFLRSPDSGAGHEQLREGAVVSIPVRQSEFPFDESFAIPHNTRMNKTADESARDVIFFGIPSVRTEYMRLIDRSAAKLNRRRGSNTSVGVLGDEHDSDRSVGTNYRIFGIATFEPPIAECCCYYTGKAEKKQDHFAIMPEALIEPCILAGSSAQACETCGAAWGRVVEREKSEYDGWKQSVNPADKYQEYEDQGLRGGKSGLNRQSKNTYYEHQPRKIDRGFAPRCACAVNTGSAASVVLDPFGGSGTVGKVAARYQRNAILIDLNQAYIELQEKRTDGVQVELFV